MRLLVVIAWALVLFILTCTENLDKLLLDHIVQFHFVTHPNFAELLIVNGDDFTNAHYLIQKIGHFTGFSILALLLFELLGNRTKVFVISALYAVLTELLQLYFSRDGRLLDMGIDTLGIAMFLIVQGLARVMANHRSSL
ncbi:VanZ family protein [Scopulibacillus cellulosilyticus]|uniref:VanZ family protein n=1 Tax=Scopulibacillus cellulosilyticus TaxID=2665665 RepID=A0ABW2Q1N9_9BACL